MQVIFLPNGSGPRRNYHVRLAFAATAAAGLLLAMGASGAYLGYSIGAANLPDPGGAAVAAATPERVIAQPANETREQVVNYRIVDKFAAANAEKVAELRIALDEQRRMLEESRRYLSDHIDSLGQRVGQLQAHVSRLNAFGQRLTDMAGLDRSEFSFDTVPAIGGPEHPVPWDGVQEPVFEETLQLLEIALREKENELSVLEALLTDRELREKQYPHGWPTSSGGWLSSAYGHRTDPFTGRQAFHEGVDIAVQAGSEIRAMAAGVVSFSGNKPGYGLVVEINHGNGYETRYAHAKELIAKVGDRVEKGDAVALVGSTGRSTGSHVHIEVLKNGKAINPNDHLNSAG
jgi:murein DD-endopeptidase MepM/ murein hydrolase activator NlpD